VSLVSFVGGHWADPRGFQAQANVLYDLASAENVDGVVSWASLIGLYAAADETGTFHERYHSLPLVAIDRASEGVPNLFVDTYEGMYAAIVHLIEAHGYQRLAFISGPEGNFYAEERYRAYLDALEAHGLHLDPHLITPPVPWEVSLGMKSMRLLLDERRLRPQVDFDAVVAASDSLLLGALETLQAWGIQVPGDVGAVGFDDMMEGRVSTPPFTTGVRPFYAVGYQAVETLLALIEGAPVPEKTAVPSGLVIRQSCGCLGPTVRQAVVGPVEASSETLESVLASRHAEVLLAMTQAIGESGKVADSGMERLLDGFVGELKGGTPGLLMRELDGVLRHTAAVGGDVAAWQGALSALRRQMLPHLQGQALALAEDLWQQARVAVAEMALRVQAQAQLQAAQQVRVLREIGATLITTFDVEKLMAVLTDGLSRLGIPSCYISLYENPQEPTEWSRLILAYNENGWVELEPGGRRFRSRELVPEKMWPQGRQFSYVVEPLYFQKNQLGFALFEVGPREGVVYETLRTQIGSALHGALLVQQVQEHSAELARQQYILDTFMENIPDRVYFKDLEGRITRANKAHAAKLELSDPVEEIGKSDFDFFPEEQARVKYEQEQEIICTGRPILNLEEPDGMGKWALTTKMPLRDEHGNIIGTFGISRDITEAKEAQAALEKAYVEVERQVAERTAELEREIKERERAQGENLQLQQEVIEAQKRTLQELSTPIIPVMERVIVMPLIGSIDSLRAKDITRALLAGIKEQRAKVVILDITGVPIVDSRVANHLNQTIQAARLKGAHTIITGVSDAVAEAFVDLEIDWSGVETLGDLQTGLLVALDSLGIKLTKQKSMTLD
jgi:PAS domain S-box-containing protein